MWAIFILVSANYIWLSETDYGSVDIQGFLQFASICKFIVAFLIWI